MDRDQGLGVSDRRHLAVRLLSILLLMAASPCVASRAAKIEAGPYESIARSAPPAVCTGRRAVALGVASPPFRYACSAWGPVGRPVRVPRRGRIGAHLGPAPFVHRNRWAL